MTTSMIVSRCAFLGDPMIFDRRFEHHAVGELIDHGALDLLPGCLARRVAVAALLLQRSAALREPPAGARAARRCASSPSGSNMFAGPVLRSMRTRSPVLSKASPPPTAASG